MVTKCGIWMDKRIAKIVSINDQSETLTNMESSVEEYKPRGGSGTKIKGGPQDVVQDSKYLEREKQQLRSFFQRVGESLTEVDELVVFGPADTGRKFVDNLLSGHSNFRNKNIEVRKADSMTDNQVKAWVREYFE